MRKSGSRLVIGLLATLTLVQPLQALADSKGSKSSGSESRSSGASSRSSESRSSSNESRSGGSESRRSEMAGRMESHSQEASRSSEKSERSDERYGHERGEGRQEWNAVRHQEGIANSANRPAMTPEAVALMSQARQAAFEYRTTGSASSLAALESLRSSLASMGFTRMPGGNLVALAPTPATPAPVGPAAGTPVAVGTSGVLTP